MKQRSLLSFLAIAFIVLLTACADDEPIVQPVLLNYWRPISNPNVFLTGAMAAQKLNYDLGQCRCGNTPINVPHQEMGTLIPDRSRLYETAAIRGDVGGGCSTTPDAVLIECMRSRGWEPTSCSGRVATPGGTQCATTIGTLPNYPNDYPYKGAVDGTYGFGGNSPAETRQRVQ
jgi:hypothetical protein